MPDTDNPSTPVVPVEPQPSEPIIPKEIVEYLKLTKDDASVRFAINEILKIAAAAPPQVPSPQVSIGILRKHYLAGIDCNHEAKTDRAMCACSRWNCPPQPSVGAAVERWLEHVQGAVIDEEFAGMATDEAYQKEARNLAASNVSREPISAELLELLRQILPATTRMPHHGIFCKAGKKGLDPTKDGPQCTCAHSSFKAIQRAEEILREGD